jgi:hypothetical protein
MHGVYLIAIPDNSGPREEEASASPSGDNRPAASHNDSHNDIAGSLGSFLAD